MVTKVQELVSEQRGVSVVFLAHALQRMCERGGWRYRSEVESEARRVGISGHRGRVVLGLGAGDRIVLESGPGEVRVVTFCSQTV